MMRPTKEDAIARLRRAIDEIPETPSGTYPWELDLHISDMSSGFSRWERNTRVAIGHIFGDASREAKEFSDTPYCRYFEEQMWFSFDPVNDLIESMIDGIEEYGLPNVPLESSGKDPEVNTTIAAKQVFVVHGRDDGTRDMVARFIGGLGLEPVILQEQPNEGRTIIEKFEDHAQTAGFAVAICTPDDVGALAGEPARLKPRMRQNVVFELGYFAGAIGRKRVCALVKGDIEKPSDYDGVMYIPMIDSDSWKVPFVRELRAAGLPVSMDGLV